jgi:excisionase family DNA binding protein
MSRTKGQRESPGRMAYSPGELARVLGVSRTFAYRLVRSGRIRGVRVGSRWLVPVREVEAFLRNKGAEEEDGT